jgi:hypothetical protein
MKLFEEYKLYEEMWDNIGRKKTATTRKPIREAVAAEYNEKELKACLDRVNSAVTTEPGFDEKYGDGMVYVSVSEELLKKALRIGNRGTFQDGAPQATTVPAQAVDDIVIRFNFEEDDEIAIVSLMLGGEDDTYYDDICVVGWGDRIAGLSDVKDMKSAKTFFETQIVPNANKIAEDIINDSWAYYQLPDYAGITSTKASTKEEIGYRVVLADYDTDDFDINVDFGMQDPDENEVIDYEYLLKPGQTKGDLVVWLSRDCGYTSIYVHDERPATDADIKRLASDTFSVTDTGDEWQDYGSLDEALTESKYKIIYSDRHTEIVDEDTMNQLVDELESFTRDDISQIRRISSTGKLGNAIWTEEEGLL